MNNPARPEKGKAAPGRYRRYKGVLSKIVSVLAVGYVIYEILYVIGFLTTGVVFLYPFAFRSSALGLLLALTFLTVPATKNSPRDRLPWYEIPLILASLVVCGYIFFTASTIIDHPPWATPYEQVLGIVCILLLLEATRRMVGLAIVVVAVFFFFYALYCNYFPGILAGKGYPFSRAMAVMYLSQDGIFGSLLNITVVVIFAFILFASFLRATGGGHFFTDLAFGLVGRMRGGPAKAAVIASSLFGTMSGSAVANVAATGSVTIPLMKQSGYRPHFAGAVEAVASTGGQLMPPVMGAAAFIMADFLGISYVKVCIAALLPAVLYYFGLFTMVHLEAVKIGLTGLPPEKLPSLIVTLRRGWMYLLPLGVLIYYLAVKGYSAEASAIYAVACLFLVSLFKKETRLGLRRLIDTFVETALGMIDIVVVCALIGIIMGALSLTGMGLNLAGGLVTLSGGHLMALLLLAAAGAYILSMGLPTTPCYIMLATLIAPAIIKLDVNPLAAHLFVYYFGMASMITPPVCPAAIVGAGIAGASMMQTGFQAMRLGILILIIPFMFVYNNVLLLEGTVLSVTLAVLTSLIGVIGLGASIEGFLLARTNWIQRILLAGAALVLIYPGWKTDSIGIGLLGAVLLWQWQGRERKEKKAIEGSRA
ncbi:MAG: TRAP transporter permease [Pseudomonadota bacterium]